ncbi:MAG TPA: hypothetical protein VEH76_00505 [Methylocystis sp.]|nr:hypothetical protein [Methylocystis sp.]
MRKKSAQLSASIFMLSATLLSGCGGESKDARLSQIFTECQLSAHTELEASTATLNDEQRHFALGASVEKCLKNSGLQPLNDAKSGDCYETPENPEDGAGFVKPMQKCWATAGTAKK